MIQDNFATPKTFAKGVLWPFKWSLAMMCLMPTLASFYDFGVNYALKQLIDAFSAVNFSYQSVLTPIVYFIAAQILIDLVWRIDDLFTIYATPKIREKIINYSYNYVQNHSYAFFLDAPGGSITSKIKSLADRFDDITLIFHYNFIPLMSCCVISSVMLVVVSAKVCLLLVFWMLVYAIFCTIVSQPMTRLNKTYADNYHDIFAKVSDSVSNIFTVKAFSRENYEAGKLKSFLSLTFIPSLLKAYWFEFKVNVVHAFIYWGMLISTFLMMVYLRMHQAISNGDMAYIMGLTLAISSRIDSARRSVEQLFREIGDFKSAFSILSLPQISDAQLPDLIIKRPSIKIKNIVFKYPENPRIIFNRLNLTIKPGEKVGIVGRSGAGKSSLVALINKHFEPLNGAIYIDNQELSTVNSASVRRSIAVIPQDCMLFHRSVMENIRYGRLEASDEEVFEAARQANLHEFITSLSKSYDTEVGERGVKLSGGQKQRIAIARAILKRAPILILDEATASLDTETERLIQLSLETFFANQTTTIIAIAHRLSTLKNMDRILVMDQGVIVEQGTHVELLNKTDSVYRKLWELQQI